MQPTTLKVQTIYILDWPRRLTIFKRNVTIQGMQIRLAYIDSLSKIF